MASFPPRAPHRAAASQPSSSQATTTPRDATAQQPANGSAATTPVLFNDDSALKPSRRSPIEADNTSHEVFAPPYALIALDRSQSSLGRELTYAIPAQQREVVKPGIAVLVPFGRQKFTGYITGFTDDLDFEPSQLKPILQVVGKAPVFDANALKLARWMSAYYHCPLADCLSCYVPAGWQVSSERKYFFCAEDPNRALRDLGRAPRQQQIAQLLLHCDRPLSQRDIVKALNRDAKLRDEGKVATSLITSVGEALKKLLAAEVIASEDQLLNPNVKPRRVQAVKPRQSTLSEETRAKLERAAPKQAAALDKLIELNLQDGAPEWFPAALLGREFQLDLSTLRGLEKKGLVEFAAVEQSRASFTNLPPSDSGGVQLNEEQTAAVQTITEALQQTQDPKARTEGSNVVLVHGVTASGKTEVYLSAIEECLRLGRRALVLVPEIALTAQTVEIFQRRFQEKVAILHSALGAGERFDEWRRASSGDADIVVGARSAIFAPLRNVGLMIIDEEHDHSYKQDATPRYHARDVAQKRAGFENSVIVLGSATPSLESYHRAQRGEYRYVQMVKRFASRPLPAVEIVDMTKEAQMGELPVLSHRLRDELCETVARGEQAIIFLNRRGFATYVQCLSCGNVEQCPNCDVTLTFHKGAQTLNCHHCGYVVPVINECPQCHGWMIGFTGTGTEKVQNEVGVLLAKRGLDNVSILRLDRDTTERKGAHAKILSDFRSGKAQVLIGTQMVTKGLDFPRVTLVGVISADTALNVPDFRAAERTFQLLAQVAGRAGRGETPGKVLIQSLATDHYAIEAARDHDFEKFVKQEIALRREPPYPPFSHVVNIISQDEAENVAKERIERLAVKFWNAIAQNGGATELLGPVSCPIGRVKSKFRFHLMLRDRNRPRLHKVLEVYDNLSREETEGLTVDVDCMSIL
jgi:primosomal protein N' (replication factor Y)